jgi:hypothetical protein
VERSWFKISDRAKPIESIDCPKRSQKKKKKKGRNQQAKSLLVDVTIAIRVK